MTLKDIQIAKQNMEAELTQIVQEFERETGLRVNALYAEGDPETFVNERFTKTSRVTSEVKVEV